MNLHYYRNFETTEKTDDGQLSLDIAGTKLPFFGFIQTAVDDQFKTGAKSATGALVEIAPVTTAFKAAVDAKKKDGEGDSDKDNTSEKDSASSMTAAIVAVSAVAALF